MKIAQPTTRDWNKFSKEIADDHYYYLRSCIRQNFFPGAEETLVKILRNNLQKDLCDDASHTTCAGIGYHSDVVSFTTLQTIAARHFSLMSEKGYQSAVVSCITSFGIYTEILETWKEFPEEMEKAAHFLKKATGREFQLPQNIVHASDLVYKYRHEIANQSKYKLVNHQTGEPLKIVDHIGCHYAKMFPEKGIGGAEFPKVLTGLVEALGGTPVDYPERRHCCGFGFRQYLVQSNRSYSLSNSKKKFESMGPYRPDAIITNCPGCNMFLDRWQYALAQLEGKTYSGTSDGIPVFTYEELAGLMLGYDPWQIGLQFHQVNVEPFLDKIGIQYHPTKKYSGREGEITNRPAFSGCLNVSI